GRDADACLDVGLHAVAGELVDEHRAERKAVVGGGLVTVPVGVAGIPIAGQATYAALPPAVVPIPLGAQPIDHGRVAALTHRSGEIDGMSGKAGQAEGYHGRLSNYLLHVTFLLPRG